LIFLCPASLIVSQIATYTSPHIPIQLSLIINLITTELVTLFELFKCHILKRERKCGRECEKAQERRKLRMDVKGSGRLQIFYASCMLAEGSRGGGGNDDDIILFML